MTSNSAPQNTNRWPPQVKYIVGNEACERFSYYGMKGILALYITGVLMQTRDQATNVIHLFGFANYFMPLIGAWVSDRFWGRYHTILWISFSYCLGHGVLATSDLITTLDGKALALYTGLGLIAFGSGGIKPCVSAFMGDQFKPEQRHLLQKAYAAFYWSINLGSFFSFLIIPFIRKQWGYSWAFGVPGIFMAIATLIFWLGTRHYVMVPPARKAGRAGFLEIFNRAFAKTDRHRVRYLKGVLWIFGLGLAAAVWIKNINPLPNSVAFKVTSQMVFGFGVFVFVEVGFRIFQLIRLRGLFWEGARGDFSDAEVDAAKSVGPILSIFLLVPVFWALFDQTFSTWVLQGEKMATYDMPLSQLGWCLAGLGTLFAVLLLPLVRGFLEDRRMKRQTTFGRAFGLLCSAVLVTSAGVLILLSLTTWRESKFRYSIGPEEMLSMNPLLVMILIPIMTWGLYPLLGRLATPLRRMSLGMFLAAVSYLIVAWLQNRIDGGAKLSVLWQTVPYIVLTIAEVLVSTTGLEFAFREAAPQMKSTIMGFWNLTVAFGNLLVSVITLAAAKVLGGGGHDVSITPKMFLFYAGLTFAVAILFSIIATKYKYRDAAAATGN